MNQPDFIIKTRTEDINVWVDFGSGDSVMVSFDGAVKASQFEHHDDHYDCLWYNGITPWEAVGFVAALAVTKGVRPISITLQPGAAATQWANL